LPVDVVEQFNVLFTIQYIFITLNKDESDDDTAGNILLLM